MNKQEFKELFKDYNKDDVVNIFKNFYDKVLEESEYLFDKISMFSYNDEEGEEYNENLLVKHLETEIEQYKKQKIKNKPCDLFHTSLQKCIIFQNGSRQRKKVKNENNK